ncbi:HTH-type transcriptional repressor YtrA [Pseudobythopirellula maris]|uniref:HTH-type transcriptional repressor YtrA n=1 Tax=Pseudobythopirellula maris TaxID=2527991 RepID=A0A5C5ZLN7_9BACT|nr:GntR family transcriptional regulator [Pseudobythopirellula maris]TWT88128.1 HTH-type transcriptional repressor YtrA [Pseudobythopirellula maris]
MDRQPSPFDLRASSGAPIYQQIVDQAYALVAGGRLKAGELLPSVREVARAADVNPMTVSKAYSQLESEGLVERERGRGMRVREPGDNAATLTQRKRQFQELLAPALHRAAQLGLSEAQVRQVIESQLKERHQ